jgi:hypothetical protein
MFLRARTAQRDTPQGAQSPACPPHGDYLIVSRAAMTQIHDHLAAEQERFPARRLRQALQIVRHILGGRSQGSW